MRKLSHGEIVAAFRDAILEMRQQGFGHVGEKFLLNGCQQVMRENPGMDLATDMAAFKVALTDWLLKQKVG